MAARNITTVTSSHSWHSTIYEEEEEVKVRARAPRRRDLREYTIPIGVLQLDFADRKVVRIAGRTIQV